MPEKVKIKLSELIDLYDIEDDTKVSVDLLKTDEIIPKGMKVESKVDWHDHADELEEKLEDEFNAS